MADFSFGASHLSRKTKLAYGVGHILNDSCASIWFTYLLVYLQYVLRLDRGMSGFLLLVGQVTDAVCTPIVGILSDKGFGASLVRYGRRKIWHAIGTICVLFSFPFIFILCRNCNWYWPYMYIVLIGLMIVVFQFGWSSVQVSHLALIPDLTPNEGERDELNIIRYFFDMLSDVLVYVIVWISFKTRRSDTDNPKTIDPSDYATFRDTTICILVIGGTFSLLFHIFTPESVWDKEPAEMRSLKASPRGSAEPEGDGEDEVAKSTPSLQSEAAEGEDLSLRISMNWRDWIVEPQFYYISLIYTCSRLVGNLSNIYIPIFLQETIKVDEELIATIPLVMSLSGCAASLMLNTVRKCASKKASLMIAILIGLLASALCIKRPLSVFAVYGIAVLFGLSSSIMIILSLAFTSDLIGYSTDSSAFVYGSISFWEKLVNGLAVFLIQELTSVYCFGNNCSMFFRRVMSIGIMIPLIMGLVGLAIISRIKIGRTNKMKRLFRDVAGSTGSSGTPISSDSSEFLIATDTKMGYGAISSL